MLCSYWLQGAFCGFFVSIFYGFTSGSSPLVLSLILLFSSLVLREKYKLWTVFAIVSGFLWVISHNGPVPKSSLKSLVILDRSFFTLNRHLALAPNQKTFLVFGEAKKGGRGDVFLAEDHEELFYPVRAYLKNKGDFFVSVSSFFGGLKERVKRFVVSKIVKYKELSPWLYSLLLGDRSFLSYKVHIVFSTLGIYHLLVLSGLHVTMLGCFLYFLLSFIVRLAYVFRLISCAPFFALQDFIKFLVCGFLVLYASIVSLTQPIQRASLTYILFLLIPLFCGRISKRNHFQLILFLQILLFPVAFLDNSTLLTWVSYLILYYFTLNQRKSVILRLFYSQIFLALLVGVCCGKLSFLGFFVNLVIVPVFSIIYCLALGVLFDAYFPPFIFSLVLELQKVFLLFLEQVAILPQLYSWLYVDLLSYHYSLRCFLLLLFAWFFSFLLQNIK